MIWYLSVCYFILFYFLHQSCWLLSRMSRVECIKRKLSNSLVQKRERENGRKEWNVLFNDALNTFYVRLYGVRHMVNDQWYSERKPAATTWATDRITLTTAFVTPVVEHWLEREEEWNNKTKRSDKPERSCCGVGLSKVHVWSQNHYKITIFRSICLKNSFLKTNELTL